MSLHACTTGAAGGGVAAIYTPARNDVQRFWEALPRAQNSSTVLRLETGTHFLGEEEHGDCLIKRDYWYEAVQQRITQLFASGRKAIGIVGNPGMY
jgi:hypothetical protein